MSLVLVFFSLSAAVSAAAANQARAIAACNEAMEALNQVSCAE